MTVEPQCCPLSDTMRMRGHRAVCGLPHSSAWFPVALGTRSPLEDGPLPGPAGQWQQGPLLAVFRAFRAGAQAYSLFGLNFLSKDLCPVRIHAP